MKEESTKPLSFPVLVDCMPDDPRAVEATWLHPDSRGTWVRPFTRSEIDSAVAEMSAGEKERFLAFLSLLSGIARQDQSKIVRARERLDYAVSLIHEENFQLATAILEMAGESVPVQVEQRKGTVKFGSSALSHLAARLRTQDVPPISEQADPRRVLSSVVTSQLRGVNLVLWFASHQFRPALYCSTELGAAYAFSLVGKWVGWEACVNCGKFFRQSRPNKKWCTSMCGNAYRVRKSQAKRRAEEKKR